MKRVVIIGFVVLFVCSFVLPSLFAGNEAAPASETKVEYQNSGCLNCPPEKLGRGVSNLVFAAAEPFYRIGKEMERTDYFGGFFSGLLKAAWWTSYRAFAGAFDVGTFIIPTKPIIHEFDAGWWAA